ncbi:MAG: hypothetical protein AAGK93_11120, partial [Pseudomonadota bacterium]
MRWWLSTDLALPRGGFRVRRKQAPKVRYGPEECRIAELGRGKIATSIAGIHVLRHNVRISGARVTPQLMGTNEGQASIRFHYAALEQSDPKRLPFARLAIVLDRKSIS